MTGIHGLCSRLIQIKDYLDSVVKGKMPINQEILQNLQLIFNLLPNIAKPNLIKVNLCQLLCGFRSSPSAILEQPPRFGCDFQCPNVFLLSEASTSAV